MRSCGKALIVALALLRLISTGTQAQAPNPSDVYKDAFTREAEVRRELDTRRPDAAAEPLLTQLRALVHDYEEAWRAFPTSGYSDNALWQGAVLSADAFWQFGDIADRRTALRLFRTLTSRFPTSSRLKQVPAQIERLENAKVIAPSAASSAAPSAAASTPASAPSQPAAASTLATSTTAAPSATLQSIRREVLPDAVRITFELERETPFVDQRLDGPPRVFIELQHTQARDVLRDARLSYADDVVRQIRVGRPQQGRLRIVLDLQGAGRHSVYALYNPYRVVVDFERPAPPADKDSKGTLIAGDTREPVPVPMPAQKAPLPSGAPGASWTAADGEAKHAAAATAPNTARIDSTREEAARDTTREIPRETPRDTPIASERIDKTEKVDKKVAAVIETPVVPASSAPSAPSAPSANASGGFSLSRQLGLGIARIVIDPGHGGHDPGAKIKGATEADLVLDVALRLEKLLQKQQGVDVILTRRTNGYIALEERTAIANRAGADLFLSVHANASANASARGVETYFLNFAPNPEAEAIAARENAGSSKTMRNLPDIVRSIALNNKIDESRDFASFVQASLYDRLRKANRDARNLGVKQAPFMVLIGATMPSILAEISFITNRQEGTLLKTDQYRQQIADALFAGVMKYQQSLKRVPAVAAQ